MVMILCSSLQYSCEELTFQKNSMKIHLFIRKDLYRQYFQALFPADQHGCHLITRDTDLGKAIHASIRYSDTRPVDEVPEGSLCLRISRTSDYSKAANRFLFFSRDDISRVNDLIEVYFNLDLDRYYLRGLKLGMQQKDVIESFILDRGLVNLLQDNETLKKRIYREQLNLLQHRTAQLLDKARYRNQKIGLSPQDIMQKKS
jgi:hypothetical protein